MAGNGLRKEVRRRLYAFSGRVARWVRHSGRQRSLQEMLVGLVTAGHVHLTKVARAFGSGVTNVHAVEKRLRRHLDSQHRSMQRGIDGLLAWSAAMVGEESLIVADLTDVAKYYARSLQRLGRVRDASDPDKRTAPGYFITTAGYSAAADEYAANADVELIGGTQLIELMEKAYPDETSGDSYTLLCPTSGKPVSLSIDADGESDVCSEGHKGSITRLSGGYAPGGVFR